LELGLVSCVLATVYVDHGVPRSRSVKEVFGGDGVPIWWLWKAF
jgi:hypothetical protein